VSLPWAFPEHWLRDTRENMLRQMERVAKEKNMPRMTKDGPPLQPGAVIKTEKAPKIGGVSKIKSAGSGRIGNLGAFAHPPKKKGK